VDYPVKNSPHAIFGTEERSSEFEKRSLPNLTDLNPMKPTKNLSIPNIGKMISRYASHRHKGHNNMEQYNYEEYRPNKQSKLVTSS
jgi:hypothetical protein